MAVPPQPPQRPRTLQSGKYTERMPGNEFRRWNCSPRPGAANQRPPFAVATHSGATRPHRQVECQKKKKKKDTLSTQRAQSTFFFFFQAYHPFCFQPGGVPRSLRICNASIVSHLRNRHAPTIIGTRLGCELTYIIIPIIIYHYHNNFQDIQAIKLQQSMTLKNK